MKKLILKGLMFLLIAAGTFVSCQKDLHEAASDMVSASKYTSLTLNDNFDLPDPAASEQYALRLFDLKEDSDGLTEKELLSVGDPAQNEDLVYALLFVEAYDRDEILWSWNEPAASDNETGDRSFNGAWKWTGGDPIASMYASGFKKWPAYQVKNRFQDPCGEIIKSGPVYQICYNLCDGNLPGPCQTGAYKQAVLNKIIDDAPVNPYSIAKQLLNQSGWTQTANVNLAPTPVNLMNFERKTVSGNIAYYTFEVSVGTDPNDKIALHRVVKETAPNKPINTDKVLFLQPGDHTRFMSFAMPGYYSGANPADFGLAVFMAKNDVDVWGIDQAWGLLPEATPAFGFMKEWGLGKNMTDLRTGMAVARVTRYLTMNYFDRMTLAGWSGGGITGFAAINHETQLDQDARHAKNYIVLDITAKTNHPAYRNARINEVQTNLGLWNGGTYQEYVFFANLGFLAVNDPGGISPFVPGFTNEQTALFGGIIQWYAPIPFHYMAGVFENNMPVGFQFVKKAQWFDYMTTLAPYLPTKYLVDRSNFICEFTDSPFDDHLGKVRLPILNVAPAGGFGDLTMFGFTKMPKAEVTHLMPSFMPPHLAMIDYGHIDLFLANNAETTVWKPMLDWLKQH